MTRPALLALFSLSLLIHSTASLAAAPVNTLKPGLLGQYTATETAILGYDTVAYFTQGRAVPGQATFTHRWNGADWLFASAAHRDLFKAMPEKYAPQYGGYCAFGVSRDYLVKIDPTAFAVVDGKLYLNYNADVQQEWLKSRRAMIVSADANFPALLKKD